MLLFETCILFLKFIAITVSLDNPRGVQVALETALTFNNNDSSANVKFLDDFQNFLSKVRRTVVKKDHLTRRNKGNQSPERNGRPSADEYVSNFKFTDFIKELIGILQSYQDNDLEDAIAVIDDEIRKYHYKGCKFYELVSENKVRRYIANKLDSVKEKPGAYMRKVLYNAQDIIENAKFDATQSRLLDSIDSLYTRNDAVKFQKILEYFDTYRSKSKRANMDLIKLVRDTIRNVIFDHYSKLNANTRRDFKANLETYFWKTVKEKDNIQHVEWTIQYNAVTPKEPQNLREVSDKLLPESLSKENENKGNNPGNMNLYLQNPMNIIKHAKAKMEMKHVTEESESEDETESDTNNEKSEQNVSESKEESASNSEESDILDKRAYTIGHTLDGYKDNENTFARSSSIETEAAKKRNRFKKIKHTTAISKEPYSAETKRHKSAKSYTSGYKDKSNHKKPKKSRGFTDGNIGRAGFRPESVEGPEFVPYSNDFRPKAEKKKHQTETTLGSRYKMQTLWVESRTSKRHLEDILEEEDDDSPSYNYPEVTKTTKIASNERPEKHSSKTKKYENKYTHETNNILSITDENLLRNSPEVSKKSHKKKDFSLHTYLQNVYPVKSRELAIRLGSPKPKNTELDRKSPRAEIKSDYEKPRKFKNVKFNKHNKEIVHDSPKQSKNPDTSLEKTSNESIEYLKPTEIKSKAESKKMKTLQSSTEEETYILSPEGKILPIKKTKNEKYDVNFFNQQQSDTDLSVEKSKEEDHSSYEKDFRTNKKDDKLRIKEKPTIVRAIENREKSVKKLDKSVEKDISNKNYKKLENSEKREIHKSEFSEELMKSVEKITTMKRITDQIIYSQKPNKPSTKRVKSIFISLENEGPTRRVQSEEDQPSAETTQKVTTTNTRKETSTPISDEVTYKAEELEKIDIIDDEYTVPGSQETEITEELQKIQTSKLPVYKPTPTYLTTEARTVVTATTENHDKSTTANNNNTETVTPTKTVKSGFLNNRNLALSEEFLKSSNERVSIENNTQSYRRFNFDNLGVTQSFLQLMDLLKDNTIKINIDAMTIPPTADIEGFTDARFKYPIPDFRRRLGNNVKMKTENTGTITSSTDSTTTTTQGTTITTTEETITTEETATENPKTTTIEESTTEEPSTITTVEPTIITTEEYTTTEEPTTTTTVETTTTSEEPVSEHTTTIDDLTSLTTRDIIGGALKRLRKKKQKRRRTSMTPSEITPIKESGNRRNVLTEATQKTEPNTETTAKYDKKSEDYLNYDNSTLIDYDNSTAGLGEDIKEFLDKYDIKLDHKSSENDTLDLKALNEMIGSEVPKEGRPDWRTELRDEKARIRLDKDMMKLYGKTVSHITISTTPWNTLYTDPFENENLLGLGLVK